MSIWKYKQREERTIKKDVIDIKPEIILDYFLHNGEVFAILDSEAFPTVDEDVIIFARIVEKNDNFFIQPIEEDEYEEIANHYSHLQKLYKE